MKVLAFNHFLDQKKKKGNFTWLGGIVYLDGNSREESLWSEEFNAGFVNSEDTAEDN